MTLVPFAGYDPEEEREVDAPIFRGEVKPRKPAVRRASTVTDSDRLRFRVLQMFRAGKDTLDIARRLKRKESTIYRYLHQAREEEWWSK